MNHGCPDIVQGRERLVHLLILHRLITSDQANNDRGEKEKPEGTAVRGRRTVFHEVGDADMNRGAMTSSFWGFPASDVTVVLNTEAVRSERIERQS